MAILKKIYPLALPLLLTGCFEDFNPHIDTTPVLCLNSLITAGSHIEVKVSHTWLYTDEEGRKNHSVPDAILKIYANNTLVDSDYIPKEGDRIRIHASSLKYGEAEAEVTVPIAADITHIDFTTTTDDIWTKYTQGWGMDADIQFDIRILMDIADRKETDDFHFLTYKTYQPETGILSDTDDDPDAMKRQGRASFNAYLSEGNFDALDPVFYELTEPFEEIMNGGSAYTTIFSDRLFNGEPKTLTFGFSPCFFELSGWDGDPEDLECGWLITLYSISESYYNWLVYADQSSGIIFGDFGDFGMADPIWGYSNVSTGAGVVAAQSSTTFTVDLKDFLKKTLESVHTP